MSTQTLADHSSTDAGLHITPLQPSIGAEVSGVDLSRPITPAQREAIRAAVLRYKVIFFRDQPLSNEQHAAFAAQFGPLYTHPTTRHQAANTAIHSIAARDDREYGERFKRVLDSGDAYHTDTSWRLVPTWGAVLRDITLPENGGDTIWVDAHLAWDALSDDLKQKLEGLHVTHNFLSALKGVGHEYPIVAHPVVRTHRETGQKILWVNFSQQPQILGVELAESRALLDEILRQYKRPELQVRFTWRKNSVAFWDNRSTVHYAVRNYGEFPRELHRILIADEPLWSDL
ncbi:taurine dioxygenase [Novosphingobium nitrogenifigens DSM 19370]|uniref:Taurine dioxygenase n=1 Tax=Novosphingobium nitrogenifigens DSM 19370 TaxID=983920 RepID=F1Z7F8_9SPHN|nr:TauD/TfdA family dioxygenase [Novosphingobium nitrogenifigens]EGD59470.1 taurine dioxygenase [Novosphingobium nitrogenifigens DSM 19370]